MAIRTLYLTSTATASPYPTTSRLLSTVPNTEEATLGPGAFNADGPGLADAGQWNPDTPVDNDLPSLELDNTGSAPGTTRQGWLWNQDLTNQQIGPGPWILQLRLRANVGAGLSGRLCARLSVVTGSGGLWTTVTTLFTTRVRKATSTTAGQAGWRDGNEVRIIPTLDPQNFMVTLGDATTAVAHTFVVGERLLLEIGFNDARDPEDAVWRLDFNTSFSFIQTPNFVFEGNSVTNVQGASAPGIVILR